MKVLVIHTSYKYRGGEDTVVSEEIKLLQQAGIEVELLEFNNDENALLKLLQLSFNFKSYLRTKQKIAHFKPDVVHIHNLHFGGSPSVIYAIKNSKIPFVVTLHNFRLLCPSGILFFNGKLFLESLQQNFPWTAVKLGVYKNSKLITYWLGLSMYIHQNLGTWKSCNKFIVLNEHARKLFLQSKLQLTEKQLVVKPNFSSVPVLQPQQREEHFLYVGRLSEEKGIKLLLWVFSSGAHQIKIAGDGPLKEEVIRYASQHPNIKFLGNVNHSEILALMQKCTALVFPSLWFEGMPLTIIEAFACGTPIIASKLGAMETMITSGYNGLHFEVNNPDDLKLKLNNWINFDLSEKTQYQTNALATYHNKYTSKINAAQLLKIYNEVTGL